MKVLLVTFALVLLHACSAAQQDGGSLEVTNQAANESNTGDDGMGMAGDDMQNSLLGGEDSFNNQNSSGIDNNIADSGDTSNQALNTEMPEQNQEMGAPAFTSGEAVRYVNRDGVNAYAQADSSSNVIATLSQGECVLANISGEYAQTRHGFIAVSDLSEEIQPRSFMGNDWR